MKRGGDVGRDTEGGGGGLVSPNPQHRLSCIRLGLGGVGLAVDLSIDDRPMLENDVLENGTGAKNCFDREGVLARNWRRN